MKAEIRLMKEELNAIERYRTPKERSLAQCTSSLEAMRATKEGLESELHQELMAQLSVADQRQVDTLNDDIRRLTKDNKEAFAKRMRLEAEKNKLENLLTNNLVRRRDELIQALQEISVEDRQRQLDSSNAQLADIEKRLVRVNADFKAQNERVTNAIKKVNYHLFVLNLIHITYKVFCSKKQSQRRLKSGKLRRKKHKKK